MLAARVEEWGIRRFGRLAQILRRGRVLPEHLQTGLTGEQEALFYLRRIGYTIVARRWKSARVRGDLDLIAWRGATLCFVEVKSRTARDAVSAETAADRGKRIQLRKLARVYLNGFAEPERSAIDTRFDVVSVYLLKAGPEFEVLEAAFGWREPGASAW